MSKNTAEFTKRMDEMDKNLAAIKHLLKQSIVSSSKLADDVQSLSTQAVSHNDKLHQQGQAAFHRVQDVENLVADFKSTSTTVIHALDESVPMSIGLAIVQTLPPTLQTALGETISPTLRNVLDCTFSEFTMKYESVGISVVREVKDTLEQHRESLATDYSLVHSGLQDVLACLRTLEKTNDTTPPDHPGSGGARHFSWFNPSRSASGGDRVETAGMPKDNKPDKATMHKCGGDSGATAHVDPGPPDGNALHGSPPPARHPLFPQGNVADFDFSHRNMESGRPPMMVSHARSPFKNAVPPTDPYRSSRAAGLHVEGNVTRGDTDDEEEASLGGRIVSPRHADRRRQALTSKISPMDIGHLGNTRYHGGPRRYSQLTMKIVHNCGFTKLNTNDVIMSYNEIIHLHTEFLAHWEHPGQYYSGPQVDRILDKGISLFPRLTTLTVDATVEFYNNLHKTSLIYLLPVIPFDCISIKMGFVALCPTGLGLPRYAIIARILMEVLPKLLPQTDTQVTLLITMTRMESGNGYDLLW